MRSGLLVLLSLLVPGAAVAGWPDDMMLDNLAELDGCQWCVTASATPDELAGIQQGYFQAVVQDFMVLASPHLIAPPKSMGENGFDIGIEETWLIPRKQFPHRANGLLATGWEAMAASGNPAPYQHAPGIRIRKGLPFSGEIEGTFRYLSNTHQSVVSGHARWSPLDGWPWAPDVSMGIGYGAYVGNRQLDVGALQLDLQVGMNIPVGIDARFNAARFAPWVGYGFVLGHARARNTAIALLNPKLSGWNSAAPSGTDAKDYQFHKFIVGLRIVQGVFQFSAAADIVVDKGKKDTNTGADTITLRVGLFF